MAWLNAYWRLFGLPSGAAAADRTTWSFEHPFRVGNGFALIMSVFFTAVFLAVGMTFKACAIAFAMMYVFFVVWMYIGLHIKGRSTRQS
jgi:hypothetical protein